MKTASIQNVLRWRGVPCFALAAAVMLCGCRKADSTLTDSPQMQSVVAGNTAFALDLYQQLKARPGNLVFSPHSLSTALAMMYAGARGQTEGEMAKTLHFNLPQDQIHAAFDALAKQLAKAQRRNRVEFSSASSLWCQAGISFKAEFLQLTRARYRAEVGFVDFNNTHQAINQINAWAERKTNGRIRNLIEQLAFNPQIILCNVFYLKARWETQFNPADTTPAPFFTTPDHAVTVPMMRQEVALKMVRNAGVNLLELPYEGNDLAMIIILPEVVDGLPNLEQRLTTNALAQWLAELGQARAHEVFLTLPRFKISGSTDLRTALTAMGMPSAFSQIADFSRMAPATNLFFAGVIHKAHLEVDEAGTEAVAASYNLAPSHPQPFKVDHPFIFIIRENRTGSILFFGRVVDPSEPLEHRQPTAQTISSQCGS